MFRLIVALGFISLAGCSHEKVDNKLTVDATWQGETLTCSSVIEHQDSRWMVSDFSFYVSKLQYAEKSGEWKDVYLATNESSSKDVYLFTPSCTEASSQFKWELPTEESVDNWQKIRFTLGVPFELNHKNPIFQEHPLNDPSMFWVWRSGHKFLRLEMESSDRDWLFHLGSVGCKAESPVRAPENKCQHPNTFSYEVAMNANQQVTIDLSVLIEGLELNAENSCKSSIDNKACLLLFDNLSNKALFTKKGT